MSVTAKSGYCLLPTSGDPRVRVYESTHSTSAQAKKEPNTEVRDETRVDLRQSGASGGRAACAVPSFRIPDRRKKVSVE